MLESRRRRRSEGTGLRDFSSAERSGASPVGVKQRYLKWVSVYDGGRCRSLVNTDTISGIIGAFCGKRRRMQVTGEDKNSYVSILINSLTKFELIFLYYHGLMHESASLRKLIEKYHILENIDFDYVIAVNNVAHYEECAFGRNGRIYSEKREYEISQYPCNRPSESE